MKSTYILKGFVECLILIIFSGIMTAVISMIGKMDYEDQVDQRNLYCQMVAEKTWPDYKGIVKLECQPEDKDHGTHR